METGIQVNRTYFIILVVSMSSQLAQAVEFKSYQHLKSGLKPDVSSLNEAPSRKKLDSLINENLDQTWVKPEIITKIETIVPYQVRNYAYGTGTRGGGSGLIVTLPDGIHEVQLLEIHRSSNLKQYNLFFPIDTELRRLESGNAEFIATQAIFEKVLSRITQVAPNLGAKINNLYEVEFPFKNWIPVFDDLPEVRDEVEHPNEIIKNRVQIAYRRTNQIVYNSRAYAAMRPLSRAALWLHEYLYALSSLEESIKTQRAVSLFFSSEFLTIAADELKLTRLFHELGLLGISRRSIKGSLPPGARFTDRKQIENCGLLAGLNLSINDTQVTINLFNGLKKLITLNKEQATIVLSSLLWSKVFLQTGFPIYKYPGQKIMADRFCLDSDLAKITQTQSAIAIDEDMRAATNKVAVAEVGYFKAKSEFVEALEKGDSLLPIEEMRLKATELKRAEATFAIQSITPFEKIIAPKILGEFNINIEY